MMKRVLALVMVVAGLAGGLVAQSGGGVKANFAGTWNMNVGKSEMGQMPAPKSQVLTITQTANEVKIALDSDGDMGKRNYTYSTKLDGTETPFPADAFPADSPVRIVSSKAEWQGSSLVITQKTVFQTAEGTFKTTYTLSADGKTLTAATRITLGDLGFDTKSVYDKV
jgi:hypothetical protein